MKLPVLLIAIVAAALSGMSTTGAAQPGASAPPLPRLLSETGLYVDASTSVVRAELIEFAPQYPLWSDGTRKRRWIYLPPGAAVDASRVDAWQFPVGTRLWKEFAYGRRVETRFIERTADGAWRFASYVWNEAGTDAVLAHEDGVTVPVAEAPAGRYAVPARSDCLACHEGPSVPVLGFSALQLSPDREPLAPHAEPARRGQADLRSLVSSGRLKGLPRNYLDEPPRIAAASPTGRAALGYLHGNCGHCHNAAGALTGLELVLAQYADPSARSAERTVESLLGHSSRFRPQGADATKRIAQDGSGNHILTLRMKTTNRFARMPPLGVQQTDDAGVALIERWITQDLSTPH